MNWDRYLTLFVAGCCLVAVGTAAGTMDASVTTEPEEAIDVDTRLLPIGSDQLWELHTKVNGADAGQAGGSSDDGKAAAGSSDGRASVDGEVRGGQEAPEQRQQKQRRQSQSADASENQQSGGASERRSQASVANDDTSGSNAAIPPEKGLLESLFDLLRTLLPVLALLALAAVGAVILRRFAPGARGDEDGRRARPHAELHGEPAPSNDVSRAWYEMTRRLDLDGRHELTPNERAAAAAERGADPEAATSLTRLFEEVRYGGEPVTDDRRERARRWLDRLRTNSSEREKP